MDKLTNDQPHLKTLETENARLAHERRDLVTVLWRTRLLVLLLILGHFVSSYLTRRDLERAEQLRATVASLTQRLATTYARDIAAVDECLAGWSEAVALAQKVIDELDDEQRNHSQCLPWRQVGRRRAEVAP